MLEICSSWPYAALILFVKRRNKILMTPIGLLRFYMVYSVNLFLRKSLRSRLSIFSISVSCISRRYPLSENPFLLEARITPLSCRNLAFFLHSCWSLSNWVVTIVGDTIVFSQRAGSAKEQPSCDEKPANKVSRC